MISLPSAPMVFTLPSMITTPTFRQWHLAFLAAITAHGGLASRLNLVKELGSLLRQFLTAAVFQVSNKHVLFQFIRHGLALLCSRFSAALAAALWSHAI